jgi:hypothetical protein
VKLLCTVPAGTDLVAICKPVSLSGAEDLLDEPMHPVNPTPTVSRAINQVRTMLKCRAHAVVGLALAVRGKPNPAPSEFLFSFRGNRSPNLFLPRFIRIDEIMG